MNKIKTDVVIIGAGISGCALARQLSKYKLKILVLDKEADIGWGTTKANSGFIHPGYAGDEGTLKLSLCRKGSILFKKNAEELNIPLKNVGSFLNVFKEEQIIIDRFRRGAPWVGIFLGLSLGIGLYSLTIRNLRSEYMPDRGRCYSCGKCFKFCPVKIKT